MIKPRLFINYRWLLCCFFGFMVFCFVLAFFSLSLETYLVLEKPITQADAIVVMAGSPTERLPAAAFLYRQGTAPKIILTNDGVFSAWSELFQRNLYEIEWAEQALIQDGIPEQAIVKLSFSESGTYYDAQQTVKYALDNKIASLIIVTSDYHTRRAYWTFSQVADERDLEMSTFPVRATELAGENALYSYKRAKQLCVEFIKLIYYEIKYGF